MRTLNKLASQSCVRVTISNATLRTPYGRLRSLARFVRQFFDLTGNAVKFQSQGIAERCLELAHRQLMELAQQPEFAL